ncbi:transcriptional regulatory protein [Janthinobacterium sp. HH01]|uniref:LysR family transcriptional regulator n=1 Tax=Janthinobacterium sp. HH01 TaxID=1198452 RepID=UPI0002AE8FCE|nr:LysR family transcriptional regulator [Janthinobacterium sp. HH01]ELX09061.1 transcriptional regulatory protein [Janthinobacterium sp. HH01]
MTISQLFNDVPVFVTVVECGSFAEAARRMHLSRSAVGKAVTRLEERLGVRMFQRTTRSKSLTDDGQAFYEYCLQAVKALQTGQAMLETGRASVGGTLRVTMPVLFGRMFIAPVLLRLAAANPGLGLDLDFRDHHLDLIESGTDMAIRNGPLGMSTGLNSKRLFRIRTVVCAAPAYIARCGVPHDIDELARREAIVYSRDGRDLVWQFPRLDGTLTEFIPQSAMRLNDLGAMLDAVRAGCGIAWLPHWLVAGNLAQGNLIELLPDEPSRFEDINVLWPDAPYLPTRVHAAINAIADSIADWQDHGAEPARRAAS